MNKKLKKVLITLISVLVCLCLTAGGVLAAVMKKRAVPVNVYSIADVSTQDFGGSTETYGTVETGHTQMIYLDKDKVLKETKVSQGDPVKKGDVLMTYDGTVEQLTLERQSLSIQSEELNLQLLGKEIDELASKIPYATTKAAFQASGRVKADTSDPAEKVLQVPTPVRKIQVPSPPEQSLPRRKALQGKDLYRKTPKRMTPNRRNRRKPPNRSRRNRMVRRNILLSLKKIPIIC